MSLDWVEDIVYTHYLDKDIEVEAKPLIRLHFQKNGHLVELDYSSPSALWMTLHSRYQPFYLYNVLYAILVSSYFLVGGFFVIVEKAGWFQSYKINPVRSQK